MILVPVAAPAPVRVHSGFDYVTVDVARRRIYAAHTASNRLMIADADTGKVLRQVEVGPMHGSAVDPVTGDVFTGDGKARRVSEVDPVHGTVLAKVNLPGPIDAIAYDPYYHRIYADEDSGTVVYVINARSMKFIGTVALPGHDEEYLAVDPVSHVVYQNIPDLREFVVIDPKTLRVLKVVKTPMLRDNHPLQYDSADREVLVGGKNGVLAVYTPSGRFVAQTRFQSGVDQCSLDPIHQRLACAGKGEITLFAVRPNAAPRLLATLKTTHDIHTVSIDGKTGNVWTVWASRTGKGDFVQRFRPTP